MTDTPNDDQLGFVAEKPEHCFACYRLIKAGQTYYLTIGQAILCEACIRTADAIRATGDLAVVVEDWLEGVQQAIVPFDRQPHVTDDLAQQRTYDHLFSLIWNDNDTTIGRAECVVTPRHRTYSKSAASATLARAR